MAVEDNELIALLDRKFAEADQRTDTKFQRMETKFDDLKIEVGVRLDGMHADIKKIAEGVQNANERLDRFRAETARNFKNVRAELGVSNKAVISRIRKLEKKAS